LPRTSVAYVDIRFFAHATEDPDRVVEAARKVLPEPFVENVAFKRRRLLGHFGNPITLFEARIDRDEVARAFLENLSRLRDPDKEALLGEVDRRIHGGSLYLRLDKQAALGGELRLCTADPIHVRIRFRGRKAEDIVRLCREAGVLP